MEGREKSGLIDHILNEMREGFDELKKHKQSGNTHKIDYDYEMMRDRKSAIMLKGILAKVHIENTQYKRKVLVDKTNKE